MLIAGCDGRGLWSRRLKDLLAEAPWRHCSGRW
jgi:hypothetical protein